MSRTFSRVSLVGYNKDMEMSTSSIASQNIEKDSKFLGVCFKILLNYMQMVGIVASFDMKWPYYARSFFSMQSGVGSLSTQLFSLECLAKRIYIYIFINKDIFII